MTGPTVPDVKKTAAALLREVAAADPEGHNQRLAEGYGVGPTVPSEAEEAVERVLYAAGVDFQQNVKALAREIAAAAAPVLQARIDLLEAELRRARFEPLGDNHHNADACPYCSRHRAERDARLQAERNILANAMASKSPNFSAETIAVQCAQREAADRRAAHAENALKACRELAELWEQAAAAGRYVETQAEAAALHRCAEQLLEVIAP